MRRRGDLYCLSLSRSLRFAHCSLKETPHSSAQELTYQAHRDSHPTLEKDLRKLSPGPRRVGQFQQAGPLRKWRGASALFNPGKSHGAVERNGHLPTSTSCVKAPRMRRPRLPAFRRTSEHWAGRRLSTDASDTQLQSPKTLAQVPNGFHIFEPTHNLVPTRNALGRQISWPLQKQRPHRSQSQLLS